jgi:hypothetical protein
MPRVARSVAGGVVDEGREGYVSAITNQPQEVAQMVEGKPAWFAIKQLGH